MNRKWLAGFTFCMLVLGLTLAFQVGGRAQSPAPSQPQTQAQAPAADDPDAVWVAGEPFDVLTSPVDVFDSPVDLSAVAGLPFPEPAAGDVFFYSADVGTDMAFAAPAEFTTALPFPGPDPQGGVTTGGAAGGSVAFVGPDPQNNITFVGFEAGLGAGNQVVTGAPFSATVTSEFHQTLGDGNKIERKISTTEYRDGQGRTRREQTLPAIGQYSATSTAPQAIFITDPVAKVSYVLDPAKKIARKMPRFFQAGPGPGGPGGPGRGGPGAAGPGGPGPGGPPPAPPQGGAGAGLRQRGPDPNVTTESLGSQNIEGVFAQGTRVVRTIPAGTVGNQSPIRVTSERWYSPDLKVDILVKTTDPMRGENTTSWTNIRRDEPAASLFQVPSDYTVQEPPNRGAQRGTIRGFTPPPPPQQ